MRAVSRSTTVITLQGSGIGASTNSGGPGISSGLLFIRHLVGSSVPSHPRNFQRCSLWKTDVPDHSGQLGRVHLLVVMMGTDWKRVMTDQPRTLSQVTRHRSDLDHKWNRFYTKCRPISHTSTEMKASLRVGGTGNTFFAFNMELC